MRLELLTNLVLTHFMSM